MYLVYMGLMLSLGAAEGLMASVVVYYAARLAGAPMSDQGAPLKRPLIFEKLMAATPSALQFWEAKCDDDGICGIETFEGDKS